MPQNQKFEIPQESRHLAEENVERARQLYLQFMDGVGQVVATWSSASSDVIAPRQYRRAYRWGYPGPYAYYPPAYGATTRLRLPLLPPLLPPYYAPW